LAPSASGSGLLKLRRELTGQIASGRTGFWGAQESGVISKFKAKATEIDST